MAVHDDGTPVQGDPVRPDAAAAAAASDDPAVLIDPGTGDCGADQLECRPIVDPVETRPETVLRPGASPLATELQGELARVGCYSAAIDGLWGPASRRALANFNRWRGSDLPVAEASPGAPVAVARTEGPVCGVD